MALLRFPEELWEKILERLDNCVDIMAVFTAYSELDGRILKNKFWWGFDQVIPHIRPWLKNDELLSCRPVCKRWCRAVDSHLENHPSRRPYQLGKSQITGQVYFPEASQAYKHYRLFDGFGRVKFFCRNWPDRMSLHDFLRYTDKHPRSRNPFIGRSVEFDDVPEVSVNPDPNFIGEAIEFWKGTLELLKMFGHHVWFLSITYFDNMSAPLHFCQLLLDLLPLVPSLKGLNILKRLDFPIFDDSAATLEYLKLRRDSLPTLPHLETLEFDWPGSPKCLFDMLVMRYSTQIRRLLLSPHYYRRGNGLDRFPELTELYLWTSMKEEIDEVLSSVQTRTLTRLCVAVNKDHTPVSSNDLVTWLMRFPNIQSFRLKMISGDFGGGLNLYSPSITSIHSLKSLVIQREGNGRMDWDVLDFFPSLEYLRVEGQVAGYLKYGNGNQTEKLFERSIKLKEISYQPDYHSRESSYVTHTRIAYEQRQRRS